MGKSHAKDMRGFLSEEAKRRKDSPLKSAFKYFKQPGMTFLGGGLPHPSYFPFSKITAEVPKAPFEEGIAANLNEKNKDIVEVYKAKGDNTQANAVELERALQYGYTEGFHELVDFLKEHTEMIHKVPYEDWDLICTIGNTLSWDATLRTFTNPGDAILVEEYSFSSALEAASALGVNTIPVMMDDKGIIPEALNKQLDQWVGAKPKFLYTICTGQNPTGSSLSSERRKAIYDIACKHDILIVEDEPYYFLQMDTYTSDVNQRAGKGSWTQEEFINLLIPSFLSFDVEGRVIRLESFSKVIAPGTRLGWIVGQKTLLERYIRVEEVSQQNPSGLSQSLVNGLLQRWGQKGYLEWLMNMRIEYTHKRDVSIDCLNRKMPQHLVHYIPPTAGMFFTFSLDATKHPKFSSEYGQDPIKVETAVYEQALKQGCLMIPGSWFKVEGTTNPPQPKLPENPATKNTFFFRGTYAAVPLDQVQIGIEKFAKAVKIEYGL